MMKIKIAIHIFVFVFFVFGTAGADSVSVKKDTVKKFTPNIKVIGHSWAVGTFKGYEEYFKKYGIKIDETSEIGTSVSWAYEKLKDVPEGKYDALCILTGINDYKRDVNYISNVFSDIFELGLTKTPVIFVYNIAYYEPASDMIKIMNKWLDETSKLNPKTIIIIDDYNEIELQKKDGFKMSGDGLHPSSYDILQNLFIYTVKNYYGLK